MYIDSYLAGSLIDAWDVDSGDKLNGRGIVGVVGPAMNVHTVYPVLMDALYQEFGQSDKHNSPRSGVE